MDLESFERSGATPAVGVLAIIYKLRAIKNARPRRGKARRLKFSPNNYSLIRSRL